MQVKSIAECSLGAPLEHSAVLLTCIKLPPVFKTFVLSIFEWPLKTGFTVVPSADDLCNYFGSKLFDTLIVFLKEYFKKVDFEKK